METPLSGQLMAYLQEPGYSAQDASAIARGMGIPSTERAALRAILREWTAKGKLLRLRQARYTLKTAGGDALTGRIRRRGNGNLSFIPDEAGQAALLGATGGNESAQAAEAIVPRHYAATAMDGDRVRARVHRAATPGFRRRRKGPKPQEKDLRFEARVLEILERSHPVWIGIFHAVGRYGMMEGDGRTSPQAAILAKPPPAGLQDGMRIAVAPTRYAAGKVTAEGVISEILGWPGEYEADMAAVMRRYSLHSDFPEAVLAEAAQLPETPPAEEMARRDDWRERCVITIDPASARDYDDAIALAPLAGGGWELAVHIADVSYYVRPGGALDAEAMKRGNSTYLPGRVVPMLPPRLCDDLCSLKQGEDRLTRLCLMRISPAGEIADAQFRDAVIRSCCRLDYPAALAVLEGRGSTGHAETDAVLKQGNLAARALRKKRMERGALDLDMPEVRVLLDSQGRAVGVETERSDAAHQMIEEFMLAANESVAKALRQSLTPAIYRVHEAPDPAKLREFAATLSSYGIHAAPCASREELCRAIALIKGNRDEQALSLALLKTMMRARYSPQALGHYGLAKGDYCHFTSPIRRYADLVAHRSFSRLTQGNQNRPALPSPARLADIAKHISETERNSAEAEREAQQLLLVRFVQEQCEAEHPLPWQVVVTYAYPQGLAVDIPALQMKGFISGDRLDSSARWFYESHARRWSSTDGRNILAGATLEAFPVDVDPVSRFLDMEVRPKP